MQPLDLVASYMQLQARFVERAAACDGPLRFAEGLEADGVMVRLDQSVQPATFRGATLSRLELDALRQIDDVVRLGPVRRIGTRAIAFEDTDLPSGSNHVFVDCTAAGLSSAKPRPVFAGDRITMQYVTLGIATWSAATIAAVETSDRDDVRKNELCPPVTFTGNVSDILHLAYAGMRGLLARGADPDLGPWTDRCRLNPARGAADHLDDPEVEAAFTSLVTNTDAALGNLAALTS
jgi:hypothetical protein